jgi:hypothetical protein
MYEQLMELMETMNLHMTTRLNELRQRTLEALGAGHYLLKLIDSALASSDPVQGQLALDAFNGQPITIRRKDHERLDPAQCPSAG